MAVLAQFPTTTKMPVVGVSVILGTGGTAGQAVPIVLMLGVGLAAGSKSAGDIDSVQSGSEADTFYGAGSSCARMCRRAIQEQKGAQVYGGFVADAAGTKAKATITFGVGPSVVASAYEVTIGGWTVTTAIPAATAIAAAATLVIAAIQAHEFYDQMPLTAATGGAGVVDLETKEANTETTTQVTNIWQDSDNLDVLTAVLDTAAQAGVGALSLATILTAAATTRYNYIVACTSDATNLGLLETHLDTYAAALQGKRQQGIAGSMDTPGNQITLARAVNAWRVQILGCELFQEQHYEIAAAWAAHRQFEEATDAGTAYKFFPLSSVKIPRLVTQYMTGTEEEAAVNAGVTPVSIRNAQAFIPRSITSRSQTSLGAPDYTVLDTANVTVTDACADDIESDFQTRYMIKSGVAFKIMDDPTDGSRPPQFVCTPLLVTYDLWGWLDEWYTLLRIVNPDSPIDYKAQVAASRVANRINAQCPIPVAGGAYIFDVALYQSAG